MIILNTLFRRSALYSIESMTRSFADQETDRIWQGEGSRKFARQIRDRALVSCASLTPRRPPEDLRNPPGNWLEALKGDPLEQTSIRINDQWRICFAIGVPKLIHYIVRGPRNITADTDLRLSRFFGLSESYWLRLQNACDLMEARRGLGATIDKIVPYMGAAGRV